MAGDNDYNDDSDNNNNNNDMEMNNDEEEVDAGGDVDPEETETGRKRRRRPDLDDGDDGVRRRGGDDGNNNNGQPEENDVEQDQDNNNNNNNNNVNLLIEDDEEDEDDDDDDDDDEEEEEETTIDGGVAKKTDEPPADKEEQKHSTDCDLVLYFYCKEPIDLAPDHPIMRPGICVSIGFDKATKLWSVFKRYVDFCNQSAEGSDIDAIDRDDLEFVHCQLLKGDETAEHNALMKNDRILVRKVEAGKREIEAERKRLQRDADRNFVQQLKSLMPDSGGSRTADIILDCQGKLVDSEGRNQQVLSSTVRAHSDVIGRRCPWLGGIIADARIKAKREEESDSSSSSSEDDDDAMKKRDTPAGGKPKPKTGAAEIEDDTNDDGDDNDDGTDDEDEDREMGEQLTMAANKIDDDDDSDDPDRRPTRVVDEEMSDDVFMSPKQDRRRRGRGLLIVKLPKYSPEAIKLLLEYCYTNRVLALGHDAFVQSCKTKPTKHQGPVPPNSHLSPRRWPNNGLPTISFEVALAGIALAEEAGLPRLSLMCEVAAAQLVEAGNVTEALSCCSAQRDQTGNDLPRIRKAAMGIILGNGTRGVIEITRTRQFQTALDQQRAVIIPTLFQGASELVTFHKQKREDTTELAKNEKYLASLSFASYDRSDHRKREHERRVRRQENKTNSPRRRIASDDVAGLFDFGYSEWAKETAKRSLKRIAQHSIPGKRKSTRRRMS